MSSDLIDRQAAIDALEDAEDAFGYLTKDWREVLEQLPPIQPAEPQIIRCKDCKYWHSGSCEYPEHAVNCQDYWVGDIDTEAEHFCGYAERKEDG